MSADGTVLAVRAHNSDTSMYAVKVYKYHLGPGKWEEAWQSSEMANVRSLSISADGRFVAVGGSDHGQQAVSGHPDEGMVRVYRLLDNASDRTLVGKVLRGNKPYDKFGSSVALSDNGQYLAVGATGFDSPREYDVGLARVYKLEEDTGESGERWAQVGGDVLGTEGRAEFGSAVAIAGDGSRIAVSSPMSYASGFDTRMGSVSVYHLEKTTRRSLLQPAILP